MSLKNVVVEGYSWDASSTNLPSMPTDSAYTFTDVTSSKVKADGKKVLLSTTIVIAGADSSSQFTFAGGGAITGSAQNIKAEFMPVALEGDKIDCPVTCINSSSGATTEGTITVKISEAGQSKVKAS